MLKFLNKPFPTSEFGYKTVLTNLGIGAFIALFLMIFQPFQIDRWQTDYKLLKLMGFGVISFIVPLASSLIINVSWQGKQNDNWKVWKEIVAVVAVIVLIALGNLLYGNFLGIMRLDMAGFAGIFVCTVLIGIFPVTFTVLAKHNRLLKINSENARQINVHIKEDHTLAQLKTASGAQPHEPTYESLIVLIADNGKDEVKVKAEELLYIESADNYSDIYYLQKGQVKKQMIRSSLKRLETQINNGKIMRCHRTYIVNLKNVRRVEGNAAGYKLGFDGSDVTVPVSRIYIPVVIKTLKEDP